MKMNIMHALLYALSFTLGAVATKYDTHKSLPGGLDSGSMNGFFLKQAPEISSPSIDSPTPRFSRLQHVKDVAPHQLSLSSMHLLHRPTASIPRDAGQEPRQNISSIGEFSTQYAIQCHWDDIPIWLLFDTGSSDTWAARSDFKCRDDKGTVHGQAACQFGTPLINGFGHGPLDGVHFFLQYGSGEKVSGPMGYSDISCGGLNVSKQQVGLANSTYWHGNNVTNGILGLAYPSLTSAYYGNIGDEAPWNAYSYPPFFTTAIAQGTIDPTFSVAIMRNSSNGVLAWGGLPPVPYDQGINATSDLLIADLIGQDDTAWRYSFYTIVPDGLKWGTMTDEANYPYIVDTGTTMIYLPPPLAEAIARSFEPEAVYLYNWDGYFVECNAIPPQFAVIIDGVEFWINPADLIYRDMVDPLTGYCAIGIASGGSGPYILGDVFLQNVVAVFDIGGGKMRFYPRK